MKMTVARGKHSRKSRSHGKLGSLTVLVAVIALALGAMAPVMAENGQGVDITSPDAEETFIIGETIDLNATITGEIDSFYWAVRTDCRDSDTTVAGNVDGQATPYTLADGAFAASIEASDLGVNGYCFTITVDFDDGTRDSMNDVLFYVADEELTKDSCKDGGWEDLGYRNQGQCVSYFASDGKSAG